MSAQESVFPPGWYVIADAAEVPRSRPVRLERFGTVLAGWRKRDGSIAAVADQCPHRGASLALGEVGDDCVRCPFHGFAFDSSGACVSMPVQPEGKIPQLMRTRSYTAREQDGWIYLWWGPPREELPELPSFPHLRSGFRTRTFAREWDASFVRVIENQLDPFHLPFVHRTSIGRGMNPEMVVHSEVKEQSIRVRTSIAGQPPNGVFYIEFLWPNLWENHISDKFSIVAAFAPISATRTLTYLRNYQRFVPIPVIGWLVDWIMELASIRVFSQDKRVVVSQPQVPMLPQGEVLVKADNAIVAYRKMYDRESGDGSRNRSLPVIDRPH